jgi:hypothetical protein
MKIISKPKMGSILLMLWCVGLSISIEAGAARKNDTVSNDKMESKFPTGCTPVGYKYNLKTLELYPGKEGALQSMYFFHNSLSETISLYQMRDKESEYSTRFNHTIKPNSWAVLAVGEPNIRFICTLGDGKSSYGKIIDCADTVQVCEYVHVKFGLNNKGNFWIVDSNTRNGAVSEVVHYGIIPGV